MKIYALCPVSDKRVNERAARSNAVITVLLLLVYAFTQSIVPVIFLWLDFLLRSTVFSRYSPVSGFSRFLVRYLGLNSIQINAGPKIFAARIGFFFTSLIIVTSFLNTLVPTFVFTGILGLFSFLEAVFGLCVACEIYPFVYRRFYKIEFQGL